MSRVLENAINQISDAYNISKKHYGIDLVKQSWNVCNIIAHSDGIVDSVQTGQTDKNGANGTASWGNFVKINHGNNVYTLVAHLATVKVKKGDKVTRGQVLGFMGQTGNATGRHLHFEVYIGGSATLFRVDPTSYINADLPLSTEPINEPVEPVNEPVIYTVVKGDNLSKIARKYNTTWQKIYNDNKNIIKNPDLIYPGQKLIIN